MARIIDRRGYTFVPTREQLRRVHAELTFRRESHVEFVPAKSFDAFTRHADGSVTVPRCWGIRNIGAPARVELPDGADIRAEATLGPGFRLDPSRGQDAAVRTVAKVLEIPASQGGGMGLVSLPCGGGKTVLFIYIIAALVRKRAAVVVHTNQLADQWEERLRSFCPSLSIGRVQGAVANVAGHDVVICMLQTLSMRSDLPPDLFRDVGIMAIDECHLVCTETFSRILSRWAVRRVFGLSATPARKDGLEQVLYSHIGGLIFSGTREEIPVTVRVAYSDVSGMKNITNSKTSKTDHVAMITQLVEDDRRTALVARIAVDHMRSKVLVLSERRAHLDQIMQAILAINHDLHGHVGIYRGQMKPEALKKSEGMLIILGTYSIASVGLDIQGLNTLVFATPRSDVVQASGRILRNVSPVFPKVIVDVYDNFSVFRYQFAKRAAFYRKSKYSISRPGDPPGDPPGMRINPCLD